MQKIFQTVICQNYYLGMQTTFLCAQSSDRSSRNSSLPSKIKIRTCKLPKDFFLGSNLRLEKSKFGSQSRGSTCDQDRKCPHTPSFKDIQQEFSLTEKKQRKVETARKTSFNLHGLTAPRQKSQSIRRRINCQINQKFPILLLPPISSNRVFIEL